MSKPRELPWSKPTPSGSSPGALPHSNTMDELLSQTKIDSVETEKSSPWSRKTSFKSKSNGNKKKALKSKQSNPLPWEKTPAKDNSASTPGKGKRRPSAKDDPEMLLQEALGEPEKPNKGKKKGKKKKGKKAPPSKEQKTATSALGFLALITLLYFCGAMVTLAASARLRKISLSEAVRQGFVVGIVWSVCSAVFSVALLGCMGVRLSKGLNINANRFLLFPGGFFIFISWGLIGGLFLFKKNTFTANLVLVAFAEDEDLYEVLDTVQDAIPDMELLTSGMIAALTASVLLAITFCTLGWRMSKAPTFAPVDELLAAAS